jgi:HEAT repeat protein
MTEEKRELSQYVEQLAGKDTRAAARAALEAAGRAALEAVRDGLSHPDWQVRRQCAMFLDHHWDAPSLRRLVLTLHDPKRKVRRAAVHSLGCDTCKAGENPVDAVPLLLERLREDKSIRVRRMAAQMLALQKPERRVIRIMRQILRDESDPKLRMFAHWGLHRSDAAQSKGASPHDSR